MNDGTPVRTTFIRRVIGVLAISLHAISSGSATVTGTLTATGGGTANLSGASHGASTATGTLTSTGGGVVNLSGTINGSATVTGTLTAVTLGSGVDSFGALGPEALGEDF